MSDLVTQPFSVEDFTGGKTDNYVGGSKSNEYQEGDNFVINNNGKLITRPGSKIKYDACPRVTSDVKRINSLVEVDERLLFQMGKDIQVIEKAKINEIEKDAFTTILGPSGGTVYNVAGSATRASFSTWNKHLFTTNENYQKPVKIFKDGNTWRCLTLGLPPFLSAPTVTPPAGTNRFIYAFLRVHDYAIGDVEYEEVSATKWVTIDNAATIDGSHPVQISNIEVLANSSDTHYDTANVKVQIYRTQENSETLFYVGTVSNGTVTYTDTLADLALSACMTLYTEGNVLEYDQPPECKYVHVVNDMTLFGNIREESVPKPNRLRFSNRFMPYAAPSTIYEDFDSEIMAVSSINIYPIVFTKRGTWRLEGSYDLTGAGVIEKRQLSNVVGCISSSSVVEARNGIYFAALDGLYFTDGDTVQKISQKLDRVTYKQITETDDMKKCITGTYDDVNNRVFWSVRKDKYSTENDWVIVAHLNFQENPFTTWSGGNDTNNFHATALKFFNRELLRGDSRGYLFEHSEEFFTDQKININASPSEWAPQTIIYNYLSCAYDFGSTNVRKWVPKIILNALNTTSLSLMISHANDNSDIYVPLKEIKYYGAILWGDPSVPYGDPGLRWSYTPIINSWRWFTSGAKGTPLRCSYKQIKMTNAMRTIDSSEILNTTVTSSSINKEIYLDGYPTTKQWLPDLTGFIIRLGGSNEEYEILSQSGGPLKVNAIELPELINTSWEIVGYRRGEVLHLLGYIIQFAYLTTNMDTYKGDAANG